MHFLCSVPRPCKCQWSNRSSPQIKDHLIQNPPSPIALLKGGPVEGGGNNLSDVLSHRAFIWWPHLTAYAPNKHSVWDTWELQDKVGCSRYCGTYGTLQDIWRITGLGGTYQDLRNLVGHTWTCGTWCDMPGLRDLVRPVSHSCTGGWLTLGRFDWLVD